MEEKYRKVKVSDWLGQDESDEEPQEPKRKAIIQSTPLVSKKLAIQQKLAELRAKKQQSAVKSSQKLKPPKKRVSDEMEDEMDLEKLMQSKKRDTLFHESDQEEYEDSRASENSSDAADDDGEDQDDEDEDADRLRFNKSDFSSQKNGRVLFELQKSFGADNRFKIDDDFADDVDLKRLPDKVKLSIASSGFDKLDTNEDEFERLKETEKSLDILQVLLPEANLFTKKKQIVEFKPVARFDPTSNNAAQLKAKPQEFFKGGSGSSVVGKSLAAIGKNLEKAAKKQVEITKGVDKVGNKIAKANELLRTSAQAYKKASTAADKDDPRPDDVGRHRVARDPSVPIVKVIDKKKWRELNKSKEELKTFKLFG